MTKRSSTYLKGISETGDIANQTLFEDLIDSMGVVDSGTTFDDSGTITVDSTVEYSTIRTVTGSTHTLTAGTGHVLGNYKRVRYTFDVDCNLTLTDFDDEGSQVGTVNPIPAGTYDFVFLPGPFGLELHILGNTGTTPGTLSTPTLVLSVGNGQAGYVITNIDANATAGVLEYSTDNVNWTTWGSYSFGTETGTITGLTNGVLYYGRYRNSATGYTPSAYATDTVTPSAGVTALPQITGLSIDNSEYTELTLTWNATSGNEDNISVERSANGSTGWSVIGTPATSSTTFTDTGLTVGDTWYYRVREIGSISYSNGPYSTTESSLVAYNLSDSFTGTTIDTNKWTIVNPNPQVVITQNNALIFTQTDAATTTAVTDLAKTNLIIPRQNMTARVDIARTSANKNYTPVLGIYNELSTDDMILIIPNGSAPKPNARLLIYVGGNNQYDSGDTGIPFDNSWKIEMDADGTVRFYYLSAPDTWTQAGATTSAIMPDYNYYALVSSNSSTADTNGDHTDFDNFDFRNSQYATTLP